jgi:hypothetical protein
VKRLLSTTLLSAALMITVVPAGLLAADQKYHDKEHNDDHSWNSHEDKAYRMWAKENHRKYVAFSKLKDEDQQAYWGWRHNHSDAVLKIDIH